MRQGRLYRRQYKYLELLREEGNGTSHLGQTTPELAHATDLIVLPVGSRLRNAYTHGYLAAELISCIRYFPETSPGVTRAIFLLSAMTIHATKYQ